MPTNEPVKKWNNTQQEAERIGVQKTWLWARARAGSVRFGSTANIAAQKLRHADRVAGPSSRKNALRGPESHGARPQPEKSESPLPTKTRQIGHVRGSVGGIFRDFRGAGPRNFRERIPRTRISPTGGRGL